MRRTIGSVWMAAARQIVWKLLLIVVIMAALELGLLWYLTRQQAVSFSTGYYVGSGFGAWLDKAGGYPVFSAAFLLLTAALMLQGCDTQGGKLRYTLQRMPVSEASSTAHWALVHISAYIVLWMAQLAVAVIGWNIYNHSLHHAMAEASALELFVEFHLDGFLHSLLPMGCIACWVRQIAWILCMGTGTAWFGVQQRRGKIAIGPAIAAILGIVTFRNHVKTNEEMAELSSLVFIAMLIYNAVQIWRRNYEED